MPDITPCHGNECSASESCYRAQALPSMLQLRMKMDAYTTNVLLHYRRNDQAIGVVMGAGFYLILGWYKNRGKTEEAACFGDDTDGLLTLEYAIEALKVL